MVWMRGISLEPIQRLVTLFIPSPDQDIGLESIASHHRERRRKSTLFIFHVTHILAIAVLFCLGDYFCTHHSHLPPMFVLTVRTAWDVFEFNLIRTRT